MILANMETQFSHHAIDYGYQVNTIHCEKGHEVVHNVSVDPGACVHMCICGLHTYMGVFMCAHCR